MIKRICVLFLSAFLFAPIVSGQTDESRIYVPTEEDMYRTLVWAEPVLNIRNGFIVGISPYVSFYQPSMYYVISFDLSFSSVDGFDDVLMSKSISTGSYEFKDGEYILHDLNAGYTMSAKLEYGKLKFTKGLPFLKDMQWLLYDENANYSNVNKGNYLINTELIRNLPVIKDERPTFKSGRFGSKLESFLKLKRNSTYIFDYSGIRLSDGTYYQSGKYIILQDKNVNTKFYLEILDDNNLKPVIMPFMQYLDRQGVDY